MQRFSLQFPLNSVRGDEWEAVIQFVIPDTSRGLFGEALAKTEAGCEPGSRRILVPRFLWIPGLAQPLLSLPL
jgi:hypothetical protein